MFGITPTHSNYIKIWATQSFVTFKTQWKNEAYENFIYFKKFFTWNDIQNSVIHTKKHIFLWKSVSFFWFDFTIVLPILQKSKVTDNLITILRYSNDNNIYIYCKEYYFDWPVDSLYKIWHIQPTRFDPYHHVVLSEKFKKTNYLKLTPKKVKLQWCKCWRKKN